MRRPIAWLWVGTAALVLCLTTLLPSNLAASLGSSPQIIISQVKITSSSGQFITLYNNTGSTIDLSAIQLQYFNNADLLKATSGKLISLTGKVPAYSYVLVNDGPVQACYQMVIDSVSLGLSSTSGTLQVGHFSSTSSPQHASILDDYVSWSKTVAAGAQTLPASTGAFLQRQPLDSQNAPAIDEIGGGSWTLAQQPDGSTLCTVSTAVVAAGSQLLAATASPPSIMSAAVPVLPAIDIGKIAPQLSEILPNPAPPQSDSTDEYIEIYNPNSEPFDLSGFKLQSGTDTMHNYVFPDDQSMLLPNEFKAFYVTETGLTLTNDGGQVRFLDSADNILAQSDVYPAATAGYAWVYANGAWQWTTRPSPNAINIISSPPAAKSLTTSSYTTAKPAAKKTTAKPAVKAAKTTSSPENAFAASPPAVASAGKIHPLTLVAVGSLALLYALYEYRHDLANTLHRFRRH